MSIPKIISEEIVFEGPSVKVHMAKVELSNGNIVDWDHAHGGDVVVMFPIDKDNNVYLVKEWRIAWKDFVLQIPAGGCDAQDDKEKLKQVHNELREEIGMDSKKIEHLITCMLAARTGAKINIYLARDLYPADKAPDVDEILEVIKMPFNKAYEMFLSGKIPTTTYTLLAFMMVKQKLAL